MRKFNKKKLPSRHTSLGADRAPHRSFYYAMGETEKDVSKPFVGVVSTWNEAAPCNIALMRQAQSVKKGVRASGGTPREFCTRGSGVANIGRELVSGRGHAVRPAGQV